MAIDLRASIGRPAHRPTGGVGATAGGSRHRRAPRASGLPQARSIPRKRSMLTFDTFPSLLRPLPGGVRPFAAPPAVPGPAPTPPEVPPAPTPPQPEAPEPEIDDPSIPDSPIPVREPPGMPAPMGLRQG
jgi:hypothetical protein